jgi:hypothetical protein
MTKLHDYVPLGAAGLVLLGCLLPFAASSGPGGQSVDLFSLPGQFAEAAHTLTAMAGPDMFGQQNAKPPADTGGAIWLARLLYIVPILAVTVVVVNLRGTVTRVLQFAVAAVWLLAPILLPVFVGQALVDSVPALGQMAKAFGQTAAPSFSLNLQAGGWLILLAALALALNASGLLAQIKVPRQS